MEIKQVIAEIQEIAKPLINKLEKTDKKQEAEYIQKLISEIEEKGWMSCNSLYLFLQGSQFDYIEAQAGEAAAALAELYEIMTNVTISGFTALAEQVEQVKNR